MLYLIFSSVLFHTRNWKIVFGIFVAIGLILVGLYSVLDDTHSDYSEILPRKNLHEFFDSEFSISYLWRPDSIADTEFVNDRIGDQLEWTKKLVYTKNIEKFQGKNILLFFGKKNKKFWGTDSKITCPGFSINSKQCKLTLFQNFTYGDLSINNFDAVIYTRDFVSSNATRGQVLNHLPQILLTNEAASRLRYKFDDHSLLASYYRGSDIVTPYAKWVGFDNEKADYFGIIHNSSKNEVLKPKDYTVGKTHFAVMFASNCGDVLNDRFTYVNELKKYVSVDIYGKCGIPPPCNSSESRRQCIQKVVKKYKFYLSFENSNCRDYITEKFFDNALSNDILPIVLGAHPDDYEYAAPPHSYVNVQDFQSPKHLAEFLKDLDKNNTLYNEYFRWTGTGEFYSTWGDLFCRLCGMLFYSDFVPPPIWKERNTRNYLESCLPRYQWYWD